MQPLAAWLVARPQNAVLGMLATLLPMQFLPALQIIAGIVMVLLVLGQGVRLAVIEGVVATSVLVVATMVMQGPVAAVVVAVAGILVPAALFGAVLRATGSLTLTVQVSALLAVAATLAYFVAVDDQVAYWQPLLDILLDWAKSSGLTEQAQLMEAEPEMTANMLTISTVLASWMSYVVYLLFGYRLWRSLPGETGNFGRFCDLNFGRVIALLMALLSVLAFAIDAAWLQSAAFVLFAVFWLQGLAVVHWMHADGHLPLFVLIATYVLMPLLHVFLVLALAVLGYSDAWFGFRRHAGVEH